MSTKKLAAQIASLTKKLLEQQREDAEKIGQAILRIAASKPGSGAQLAEVLRRSGEVKAAKILLENVDDGPQEERAAGSVGVPPTPVQPPVEGPVAALPGSGSAAVSTHLGEQK